ncbi:YbhB/YbcL family Raf kinase inhibitor-like protein [Schumannella sp. 10F1B-5-1]|uniref:YbhB/YbcL family Raf kinase inhibitor-like protein n=1 Tax=Schumannella sp. 10F1B-5-1 TaxID=2590780 RepID=UPI0011315112|nr:YbhB/YbcL family Raf kinase inhibitor-like protein [Schumannella sp. 10F1B-5-1]TPW70241.1 YbhB/YbcL family Raf kinase inhibitor-like protein [Schumannella sp. 10F1B-5-1]
MNDPNWRLPEVPSFDLTSTDVEHGGALPTSARSGIMGAGGDDRSPALAWSDAPEGTQSFVLTCYDPDAPTGSGFWHWSVRDIPASTTSLPADAGNPDAGLLPAGAVTGPNEVKLQRFLGAAPPSGHGEHRYFFTLTALDVPTLEVDADASPAVIGFTMLGHVLGRAQLVGVTSTP